MGCNLKHAQNNLSFVFWMLKFKKKIKFKVENPHFHDYEKDICGKREGYAGIHYIIIIIYTFLYI